MIYFGIENDRYISGYSYFDYWYNPGFWDYAVWYNWTWTHILEITALSVCSLVTLKYPEHFGITLETITFTVGMGIMYHCLEFIDDFQVLLARFRLFPCFIFGSQTLVELAKNVFFHYVSLWALA